MTLQNTIKFFETKKVNTYKSDITFPVWYVVYAVFACYTMLAVREDHALYGAVLLTVLHFIVRYATLEFGSNWQRELGSIVLIFIATHVVGVFNRYLVERAQRETFMETRQGGINFMIFMNF